jgi:hypothetical protein
VIALGFQILCLRGHARSSAANEKIPGASVWRLGAIEYRSPGLYVEPNFVRHTKQGNITGSLRQYYLAFLTILEFRRIMAVTCGSRISVFEFAHYGICAPQELDIYI